MVNTLKSITYSLAVILLERAGSQRLSLLDRTYCLKISKMPYLNKSCNEDQWDKIANTCWSIWRCRNDVVYGGKLTSKKDWDNYYRGVTLETQLRVVGKGGSHLPVQVLPQLDSMAELDFICFLDGSWVKRWQGGIGVSLFCKGELLAYKSAGMKGCSPLQVEAYAIL